MYEKTKKEKGWVSYIFERDEWVLILKFLRKPVVFISLIYFVLFIFLAGTKFYKDYNFLLSFISLILGLFIKKEWDRYNGYTDYKNKAVPAIGMLDGLYFDIKKRISIYELKLPSKSELSLFLSDICTRIIGTKLFWETFNPEWINPTYKKYDDLRKKVSEEESKSEQIIEVCEKHED